MASGAVNVGAETVLFVGGIVFAGNGQSVGYLSASCVVGGAPLRDLDPFPQVGCFFIHVFTAGKKGTALF